MSLILWGQSGDYAVVVSGGEVLADGAARTPTPALIEYVAAPPDVPLVYQWDSFGQIEGVLARLTYTALPPIFAWESEGHAPTSAGTVQNTDRRYKYEVGPGSATAWDSFGIATGPQVLSVATFGALTVSAVGPPSLLHNDVLEVPYGITETLSSAGAPTLLEDTATRLDVNGAGLLQVVAFPPDLISSTGAGDQQLLVASTPTLQVTGFPPDLVSDTDLLVGTAPIVQVTGLAPTLVEQGLLPPVISMSDALLITQTIFAHLMGGGPMNFEQMTIDTNRKAGTAVVGVGGAGGATVSAGGRGLYFEPQTIDKLLDEIRKAYKLKEPRVVTVEKVIEKQPIYVTASGPNPVVIERTVKPAVIVAGPDDDEEEIVQALMLELANDD